MANETQKAMSDFTGKAVEAFGLVADANQKILGQLMDLFASTAREGMGLYTELQSSAVRAAMEGPGSWLRRQSDLAEWLKNPITGYQKSLREATEETQRAFRLVQSNAKALSQSAQRLQTAAEEAAGEMQRTLDALAENMRAVYMPSEK